MEPDSLIDKGLIRDKLTHEAPWCEGHGADGEYLGAGLLYYTIVYMLKARTAVCLGSGGGFVPRLMRQAQYDLGLRNASRTVLVDADFPEAGWGAPTWLDPGCFFRKAFNDIEILIQRTDQAARDYFAQQSLVIDYLHIDADHSFDACLADFRTYRSFLRQGSVITLHDTEYCRFDVGRVVEHIRALDDCELIDFRNMGAGLAVVRIGEDPKPVRQESARSKFRKRTVIRTKLQRGSAPRHNLPTSTQLIN